MPASCCIKNCRNKKKDGISLFKFPLKREDHLKKWLQNIGDLNFKPRKLDVICSAHFQQKDFMSKRGENGLLLNYSAVPSIFHSMSRNESPQISIAPEDSIANPPTTFSVLKNSVVDLPSTSAIIATDHQYCATLISNLSTNENTSMNVSGIVQDPKKKKKRIMHSSTLHFKSQEISPRKKQMQREIKTLKEKLRRKDEKLLALQDLIKQLRQKNFLEHDGYKLILKNFNGMVGDLFKNEWQNRNKSTKGCRYTDEIKKFALMLHFYSPKAYNYCRSILHLPHASSMRNWLSSINMEPGFLNNVFKEISKFPP